MKIINFLQSDIKLNFFLILFIFLIKYQFAHENTSDFSKMILINKLLKRQEKSIDIYIFFLFL